jgi:dipeptidyl aminopeptidase/acylaminoacyl peptidase
MMRLCGILGRVLVAAVLAMLFSAGNVGASPPGPRLAVAKVSWHPWRTTLVSVSPDGSRPVRLAGGEQDGPLDTILLSPLSWSPGGEGVAFSGINTIYLVKADGGPVGPLNVADAGAPVYAPDGRTIAFSRGNDREAAIWTIDLVSGAQHRLTASRRGLKMVPSSFSPDGSLLLATRIDRRTDEVEPVSVDLQTGKVAALFGDGREPVYSPDGTEVAFFREIGKRRNDDLFVLDIASGKLRRLTRTPYKVELFASWDPSGERIAFSRFRGQHYEWANAIVQINADGSCEREVLAKKRTVFWGAAWQPGPGRGAGSIDC